MKFYKVAVKEINLGNGKLIQYGNSREGFPARVVYVSGMAYGISASAEDLTVDDKVIEITEAEFENELKVIEQYQIDNPIPISESKQRVDNLEAENELLKAMVADLGLAIGGGL